MRRLQELLTFVILAANAAADVSDDITAPGHVSITFAALAGGCADSHPLLGDLKDDAAVVAATELLLRLFHVLAPKITRVVAFRCVAPLMNAKCSLVF